VSAILETERLLMRPIADDDFAPFAALYADPDVMRHIGLGIPLTTEQARDRLAYMVDHWRRHGFGMWSLRLKDDGTFIGRCGLRYLEDTPEIELGYTLHKAYWGQGFATESSRAVVRYAFEVLKLERLVAIAHPDNAPSVNVMRKVGMTFERTGEFYGSPCVLYAMGRPAESRP
jgi:ribosomal-protein-alanine N-acetyltransferase